MNFLKLANKIVNEWRNLSNDERKDWYCTSGIFGFIEQWSEELDRIATTDNDLDIIATMDDNILLAYTMIFHYIVDECDL